MLVNIFVFVLGAVIGSFLNVCICRLPRDKSILFPPSHCPNCNARIRNSDLVPIVSYLLLRGKCRGCGKKISIQYPLVELIAALTFLFIKLKFSYQLIPIEALDYGFFFLALFCALLIIIFFVDLEHQVIPDSLIYIGVPAGLIFALISGNIIGAIVGGLLGLALFWAIAWFGRLAFKKEALGQGDIRLAVMMGVFLGWEKFLLAAFLSYIIGAVAGIALLAFKNKKLGEYIPFGPAMVCGAYLALFYGSEMIAFYLA
ncbi:MAG: prepilin peptidase, partial [Candidatus Margulisbacteria bacterium]|nr:prepilin peptidase [Candidatus Margulisiibacteriota bacterium]